MYVQQNLPPHVRCLEWWLTHGCDRQTFFNLPDAVAVHAVSLDVHVVSQLQDLTLHEAAITCGHVPWVCMHGCAAHATAHLVNHPASRPIVAEFLGDLAEDAIIHGTGHQKGHTSPTAIQLIPLPFPCMSQPFKVCIAISLWRGNARLWLNQHLTLSSSVDSVWLSITFNYLYHYFLTYRIGGIFYAAFS